jgi:hypothetical protein
MIGASIGPFPASNGRLHLLHRGMPIRYSDPRYSSAPPQDQTSCCDAAMRYSHGFDHLSFTDFAEVATGEPDVAIF